MTAAIATALALGALATPAYAETLTARCVSGSTRELNAWAFYTPGADWNAWYEFQYELGGNGIGDQSNVNIWVMVNGAAVASYRSPDDRDDGIRYTWTPSYPIFTHAPSSEWAAFEAIFDVFASPDPRCSARTQPI